MSVPPKYTPPVIPFADHAADFFDKRHCDGYNWTPLGILVQVWWESRKALLRECPDTVKEMEKHAPAE